MNCIDVTNFSIDKALECLKDCKVKETIYFTELQYAIMTQSQVDNIALQYIDGISVSINGEENLYRIGFKQISPSLYMTWLENEKRTLDKLVEINVKTRNKTCYVDPEKIAAVIKDLSDLGIEVKTRNRNGKLYLMCNFKYVHFSISRIMNVVRLHVPFAYMTSYNSFKGTVIRINAQ